MKIDNTKKGKECIDSFAVWFVTNNVEDGNCVEEKERETRKKTIGLKEKNAHLKQSWDSDKDEPKIIF